MNGRPQVWALLGAFSCALACGNEAVPGGPGPAAGTAGVGTAGTNAGVSGAGSSSGGVATGGSSSGNGGSGGSVTAGSATGGASAGMGGAGGSSGGSGGNAGSAGSGGSAGAGGSGSTLPKRVLLYHFSTYAIPSVPAQITLLKTQLMTWGYEVEDSVKPEDLSATNLARFGGVGMINTCFFPFGDGKMGETETAALKAFVEAGGGLFGTHCASVTFQSANPPHAYNALIGGRGGKDNFDGKSACTTTAEAHVSTAMLPATFEYTGNVDNADYVAPDTKVLVKCKWSGAAPKDKETAVSWYRTAGKGRVFYTNFAKVDGDISDATFGQKHILVGLGWTLGR